LLFGPVVRLPESVSSNAWKSPWCEFATYVRMRASWVRERRYGDLPPEEHPARFVGAFFLVLRGACAAALLAGLLPLKARALITLRGTDESSYAMFANPSYLRRECAMARIDVDAHVDETDATWEFMSEAEAAHKPVTLDPGMATVAGDVRPHRLWLIDGNLRLRRWRDDVRTGTVEATRELSDVAARVAQMDELNVDVQVLYPTLFLGGYTDRAEVDVALTNAYNRWMADATQTSDGRLRWVALPSMQNIEHAVAELRVAKDHGACGVFKKGIECGRSASDPYFFPLYEEAARLDMPICIHTGTGNPPTAGADTGGRFNAISAFTDLAMSDVPERYPELRTGWIETGASWVPFLQADLAAKAQKLTFHPFDYKTELFKRCRFYVACDTTDDIPYILKFASEDHLMIGTDYTHADQSAELRALDVIERMGTDGVIPVAVAKKIVDDNPRRFYGI
jgi:predicted TIM-barrel fold metal-dependent hydrolase